MSQQLINLGSAPNDGNGDDIRSGGEKINENFTELYGRENGIIAWDMTTNAFPTGGKSGQEYYGTGATTLQDSAGNTLPLKVIAKALQDNPTLSAHFAFINVIF